MGHQNDKLDPAFTMRRNLPRNISNKLELIGFKLKKKILGLRNMQKKLKKSYLYHVSKFRQLIIKAGDSPNSQIFSFLRILKPNA